MQQKPVLVDTLFKRGKEDHDRGILRAECPYRPGSSRCAEWTQGWDAALKARFGRAEALKAGQQQVKASRPALTGSADEDSQILGDVPSER